MARLPRLVLAGHRHLLVLRALDGQPAFADAADRQAFIDALREALATERVQLHAYALLPGEVRLLATPPGPEPLSRLMQSVGRRYVRAYNQRRGRSGTLWDGRFRCAVVEPGANCLEAMVWIDASTDDPQASSAAHHTGARRDSLLVDPSEYWSLGNTPFEREGAYRARLGTGLSPARALEIRHAALGGWAVGSPNFLETVSTLAGRPARPRPRGRPPRLLPTT